MTKQVTEIKQTTEGVSILADIANILVGNFLQNLGHQVPRAISVDTVLQHMNPANMYDAIKSYTSAGRPIHSFDRNLLSNEGQKAMNSFWEKERELKEGARTQKGQSQDEGKEDSPREVSSPVVTNGKKYEGSW